jgi:DNA-binding CsgD family transcriptional regulator
MSRLTHTDYGLACTTLQKMYALREASSFPQELLSLLSTVVEADVYSYNEFNVPAKTALYTWHPRQFEVIPDGMKILGHYLDQIPFIFERQDATRFSDCIETADFQKLPIYHEFYRPMRVPFTMGLILCQNPREEQYLGFHHSRRDFTDRDVLFMNLLRPHVIQAFQQAKQLTALGTHVAGLDGLLDENHQAVICLDEQGQPTGGTQHAWDLLQAYCPPSPHSPSRLPEVVSRWIAQRLTEHRAANSLVTSPFTLLIEQSHGQLSIKALRQENGWFLVLEEQSLAQATERLRSLGLTQREIEVLHWVAQGKSNPEIGTILGISPRTVQKHLERVYRRLGVENRHAAIHAALSSSEPSSLT